MNSKTGNNVIWFLFGSLLAFLIFIIIITSYAVYITPEGILEGFKNFQTLITGVFAVLAAVFTAWIIHGQTEAVYDQIKRQDRRENERRERSEYAARSVLPHALSSVINYGQACVKVLRILHKANESTGDNAWVAPENGMPKVPELSDKAIKDLRENIEVALDIEVRKK